MKNIGGGGKKELNTINQHAPMLPLTRYRDNIIILEDLEFSFPREQLEKITELHNEGLSVEDISIEVRRNEYEVLLAIVHQHRQNKIKKELAYRRNLK